MPRGTYSPYARSYALHQPTHSTTRRGCPQTNYKDYIQKLTGLEINELVEASEDLETSHELVVTCVDPQYPTRDRVTRARLNHQPFSQLSPLHCIISELDSQSDSKSTAVFGVPPRTTDEGRRSCILPHQGRAL